MIQRAADFLGTVFLGLFVGTLLGLVKVHPALWAGLGMVAVGNLAWHLWRGRKGA